MTVRPASSAPVPPSVREPDARYLAKALPHGTLVDSCVLIDVLADDPTWADWSLDQLEAQLQLLTRDVARYRSYFPALSLVAPT